MYPPVPPMKVDHMVFVAVHDAVFTDGPTGCQVTCEAAIEISHGISVLLGDSKQALSLSFRHVQSDSVTILLVA